MKIQRVLLRVRAASVQVFSQVEMDLSIFFEEARRHLQSDHFFRTTCSVPRWRPLHTSSEDRRWLHFFREPHFSCCCPYQINGLSLPRYEVDFTWCETASLAGPQEPTTAIECGTPRLLSLNRVMLSKNIPRHEMAQVRVGWVRCRVLRQRSKPPKVSGDVLMSCIDSTGQSTTHNEHLCHDVTQEYNC